MNECENCKLLKENKELIFETKYWKIILADNQYYLGRCYIALKRHALSLSELTKEEISDFLEVVKKIENSIKKAFKADMFNWSCLMNNAYKEEIPNPHVHWHFCPRYKNKVEFQEVIFEDKEFAHHYDNKKELFISQDIRKEIIAKIKENI